MTRKLVRYNPVIGTPRLKANQKDRYLTQEEIQRLLAASDGDLKDMVVLALGTGMRASEVLSLTREDVNLKQALVIIRESKNQEGRAIPILSPVVEMFRQRPTPLHAWFPDWSLPRLLNTFPEAAAAARLSGVTFHTLRHTFASHAVMAGVDLLTLARLLGHKDVKHTQRYVHLAPDFLRQASHLPHRPFLQRTCHKTCHMRPLPLPNATYPQQNIPAPTERAFTPLLSTE